MVISRSSGAIAVPAVAVCHRFGIPPPNAVVPRSAHRPSVVFKEETGAPGAWRPNAADNVSRRLVQGAPGGEPRGFGEGAGDGGGGPPRVVPEDAVVAALRLDEGDQTADREGAGP